jgi:NAD(P)-dependent dehydrogenase (short-subunit alcohol dehydrogenase family)
MGELEKDRMEKYTMHSAIKRSGRVEEIANLFAFCVSGKASYLTGVDILCDGGCIASRVSPFIKN